MTCRAPACRSLAGTAVALACLALAGSGSPLTGIVPAATAARSAPAGSTLRSVEAVGLPHAPAPSPPAVRRAVAPAAAQPSPQRVTRQASRTVPHRSTGASTGASRGTPAVSASGSRTAGPAPVAAHPGPQQAAVGTCPTGQLAARVGPSAAASGHTRVTVVLTNPSTTPCTLDGFPVAELLRADGAGVPTVTVDGAAYTFPPLTPAPVTLAGSGGQAVLALETVDMPGTGSCQSGSSLTLTLPGGALLRLPLALLACDGGRVHVSPILSGGQLPAA